MIFTAFFESKNVINKNYTLEEDHSIEVEAFSNENLKIPYAAVMAIYETEKSISMVHSYSRNHSLIEESKQDYQQKLKKELEFLRAQNPFRDVDDPVEWQRQQRKDRELPR